MKKLLMPFIIGLCSCTSERSDLQTVNEDARIVKVGIIEMNADVPESRWVYDEFNKFGWKSNDVLGIFPYPKGSQLEFPIDIEEGVTTETAVFDGGGWAFKGGYTYSAYTPYNLLSTKGDKIQFSYANQFRRMIGSSFDLRESMLKVSAPSTVKNGTLYFGLCNVESFLQINLRNLPPENTYTSLTLYAEGNVIPQVKEYDLFSTKIDGKTVTITDKVLSYDNHLTIDLMNVKPVDNNILIWMAFPAIGTAYGTLTAVVKDIDGNLYVGEVLDKDGENSFEYSIDRNTRIGANVISYTSTNSVTGSIENWEIGEVIMGSAN